MKRLLHLYRLRRVCRGYNRRDSARRALAAYRREVMR